MQVYFTESVGTNLGTRASDHLKGHSQLWDHTDLDTSFLTLKNVHPNLKPKYIILDIHFNIRTVLLDFQSFTEKPVFECAFPHCMILF